MAVDLDVKELYFYSTFNPIQPLQDVIYGYRNMLYVGNSFRDGLGMIAMVLPDLQHFTSIDRVGKVYFIEGF